jgi:HEAT repeat protein
MYSRHDIQRRLNSPRADDRRVGAVMIGKARFHDMSDALTEILATDRDAEVRAMAAWSLDLLGNVEAVPALIDALYDEAFGVRSNAGWALVHLAERLLPQVVLPDVIDVLKDKKHFHARQMAFLVLSHIDDDEARRAIKQHW